MGRSARKPKDFRDLDGILILDKSIGISSNRALQDIRFLFKANKGGHTGSLDPLATGVLPICFGEATKFSSYLLNASKTYRAHCQLGKTTTTGDAEGEVLTSSSVDLSNDQIDRAVKQFVGEIDQIPPMYSAVKHQGKRLYELARKGQQVEREARRVTIHSIELISCQNNCLVLDVHCSKGTYIRTLAEDIGQVLGCGAYLSGLHRSSVEPFQNETSYSAATLGELAAQDLKLIDAVLLPVSAALSNFSQLELDEIDCLKLQQGRIATMDENVDPGIYRLISRDGQFIGLGEALSDGSLMAKRLMNTAS
jgi:tRNA pseudouridine55 synthase